MVCDPTRLAALAAEHADQIDLLLTDVIMPGMSGTDLVGEFGARWPDVRIVYTTGYTEDETLRIHQVDRHRLLEKPFLPSDLLRTVRDTLDAPVGSRDEIPH